MLDWGMEGKSTVAYRNSKIPNGWSILSAGLKEARAGPWRSLGRGGGAVQEELVPSMEPGVVTT